MSGSKLKVIKITFLDQDCLFDLKPTNKLVVSIKIIFVLKNQLGKRGFAACEEGDFP